MSDFYAYIEFQLNDYSMLLVIYMLPGFVTMQS